MFWVTSRNSPAKSRFDPMFLPQTFGGAESANARFGGNAGAGQDDDGAGTR